MYSCVSFAQVITIQDRGTVLSQDVAGRIADKMKEIKRNHRVSVVLYSSASPNEDTIAATKELVAAIDSPTKNSTPWIAVAIEKDSGQVRIVSGSDLSVFSKGFIEDGEKLMSEVPMRLKGSVILKFLSDLDQEFFRAKGNQHILQPHKEDNPWKKWALVFGFFAAGMLLFLYTRLRAVNNGNS